MGKSHPNNLALPPHLAAENENRRKRQIAAREEVKERAFIIYTELAAVDFRGAREQLLREQATWEATAPADAALQTTKPPDRIRIDPSSTMGVAMHYATTFIREFDARFQPQVSAVNGAEQEPPQ